MKKTFFFFFRNVQKQILQCFGFGCVQDVHAYLITQKSKYDQMSRHYSHSTVLDFRHKVGKKKKSD